MQLDERETAPQRRVHPPGPLREISNPTLPPSSALLFTTRRGAVLRNLNFRRDVFDDAATAAGLPGLTPHELRHTAASLAISAGANVKSVQRMLGHASAAMTLDVYSGLFDDDLDRVADELDTQGAVHATCIPDDDQTED